MRGRIRRTAGGLGRYVARHHIGLLALFIALGGTAYAVTTAPRNSVVSKSIRADAVRGSDVKDRALGPADLKLVKRFERPGIDQANSSTPSIEAGKLNVTVPRSGLVAIFAHTELSAAISGSALCSLNIRLPGESSQHPLIQESSNTPGSTYYTYETTPGSSPSSDFGASGVGRGGWVIFRADPGVRSFEFVLSRVTFGGSASCGFRNTEVNAFSVD